MYDKNGEKSHEIVINLIFKTANYMKRTKATEKKTTTTKNASDREMDHKEMC